MAAVRITAMTVAAFALVATAGLAHAAPAPSPIDSYLVRAEFIPGATVAKRTLEWDAKRGRWGLRLDMGQRQDGQMQWKDVAPGVYYRVTPRLHIGVSSSLASDQVDNPRKVEPQPPAPRVRLETTFKF
jgi:hypothetical protein